jgi:hypothetical protein
MCVMNIAVRTYYDGGMPVATTTNLDKMTRTAREMTEAQRDSWEALTENLAAAQRRSLGLAQDGMEFLNVRRRIDPRSLLFHGARSDRPGCVEQRLN